MNVPAMIVTDLDGTLRRNDGSFNAEDLETLEMLGRLGTVRVIATGRSPYSFRQGVVQDLPVDYVVTSSGAGIIRVADGKFIRKIDLDAERTEAAATVLLAEHLDFMIHRPIPDNHHFVYVATGADNPDFYRRIDRYKEFAVRFREGAPYEPSAQLLAVTLPEDGPEAYEMVKQRLTDLSVIRSTSPLDHQSTWIEIFPKTVSKSQAAAWLAEQQGISPQETLCLGNDYNDLDLLEWAGQSFLVSNAPESLRRIYPSVASNDHAGLAEAVRRYTPPA